MRRIVILIALIIISSNFCQAQENKAGLKDGKIVVETKEGVKALDYNSQNKYVNTGEQKMVVKSANVADEAVKVFKTKGDEKNSETVWVIKKPDGSKSVVVEKEYNSGNGGVIFSPDGNYAFYLGAAVNGVNVLYGLNLSTQQQYQISPAANFTVSNCPQNKSYIAVQKNGTTASEYAIYDFAGNSVNTVNYTGKISDISNAICY